MTAVKERPILFSGPMVRAILSGAKTQTRRAMKPQPTLKPDGSEHWWPSADVRMMVGVESFLASKEDPTIAPSFCPFGGIGDRLWVRETWQSVPFGPHRDWPGCPDLRPRKVCELNRTAVVIWRADGEMPGPEIWRPSIHMPRWAVRSWFEITEVRCGRVREMSQDDAIAGGVSPSHPSIDKVSREFGYPDFSRSMRAQIYEMDHGEGAWERDWVWMIGVKRIEGGV